MKLQPFASKELPDIQKKLFRRAHGFQHNLVANSENIIEFIIPYAWCKVTTLEIINLPAMMQCDLTICDTSTGTYSTIPNYKLNQFGFNVNVAKNYYKDHSEYDADLYLGMKVCLILKNTSNFTDTIGINLTLHEVV